MILVIFGHFCPSWTAYFIFTSPIKIPLFFAITGYCFNYRNGDTEAWCKNTLRKLFLPWFILSLLWFKMLIALIRGDTTACVNYVIAFISGKTLWYMPCCIIAECIHFIILKISRRKAIYEILWSGVVATVGLVLARIGIGDFMLINTAMIVQAYIIVGNLLKQWIENTDKLRGNFKAPVILAIVYFVLGGASMVYYPGKTMDVHTNTYYNIVLLLCMVIVGISALFLLFSSFSLRNILLSFIGQNTLVFYMLNPYAVKILNVITRKMGFTMSENLPGFLIKTLFVCLICTIFSMLINRGFPWILGKKYNHR